MRSALRNFFDHIIVTAFPNEFMCGILTDMTAYLIEQKGCLEMSRMFII